MIENPYEILNSINWQDSSKFLIQIHGKGSNYLKLPKPDILTATISSIELADIQDTPVEEYIGEEWRFTTGRLENYQLSITFRDYDYLHLYRNFANAKQKFSRMYPDDQKIDITLRVGNYNMQDYKKILTFKDSLLVSVSPPTFDNSATASIAEFTTVFKSSYYVLDI